MALPEDETLAYALKGDDEVRASQKRLLGLLRELRTLVQVHDTEDASEVLSRASSKTNYSHNARVQRVLADEERMVGRLTANRQRLVPIGQGTRSEDVFSLTTDNPVSVAPSTSPQPPEHIQLDDSDFAELLGKEDEEQVIEHAVIARALRAVGTDAAVDVAADFSSILASRLAQQRHQQQRREQQGAAHKTHHRDSKHRKIIEDVHQEIVGFMAPVPYPQSQSSVADALYKVLFDA